MIEIFARIPASPAQPAKLIKKWLSAGQLRSRRLRCTPSTSSTHPKSHQEIPFERAVEEILASCRERCPGWKWRDFDFPRVIDFSISMVSLITGFFWRELEPQWSSPYWDGTSKLLKNMFVKMRWFFSPRIFFVENEINFQRIKIRIFFYIFWWDN